MYYTFILHQTTTSLVESLSKDKLYYTFILHQTTTRDKLMSCLDSCIIPSFYIKPQHILCNIADALRCIIPSFYIKPQPYEFTEDEAKSCIIPSFYIKPQLEHNCSLSQLGCIIPSFYIKPQHIPLTLLMFSRLKTILGDMKLFDETYLIQSY